MFCGDDYDYGETDYEETNKEPDYEIYDEECDNVFDTCPDCLSINEIDDTVFNR